MNASPLTTGLTVSTSVRVADRRTAAVEAFTGFCPLFGLGVTVTADAAGPCLSMTSGAVATAPQFPWESWVRTATEWVPSVRPLTMASGMVRRRSATGPDVATVIAVGSPESTDHSPPVTAELPEAESLPVAETATSTEPLVAPGSSATADVVGPWSSAPMTSTELNVPQLPRESWPRT